MKALGGDYGSLIATQSYFGKARELGANDPWIDERLSAANQALETSRPMAQVWAVYAAAAAKARIPASRQQLAPDVPGQMRFPVR
jgi:hypothetical protein